MEATDSQTRRRINISSTTKGVLTYDITVETVGKTNMQTLHELQDLRMLVEKHVPVVKIGENK